MRVRECGRRGGTSRTVHGGQATQRRMIPAKQPTARGARPTRIQTEQRLEQAGRQQKWTPDVHVWDAFADDAGTAWTAAGSARRGSLRGMGWDGVGRRGLLTCDLATRGCQADGVAWCGWVGRLGILHVARSCCSLSEIRDRGRGRDVVGSDRGRSRARDCALSPR
ncbi:hypothetical protein EJ03DRAFT_197276 [Teratosphaeria nubilosa]|uniref:Uncharacterized protein n=1 Tax=Teratosphaeria nubilosa TaxID=161662 RepID=A0A6G1KYQ1_9PEZI|nr:hypothetical protein EJ03DRAFT_197276 [Teratosphaeria nubilosa]